MTTLLWETYTEEINLGCWEDWGTANVPDGCYWIDAGYSYYKHLSEAGFMNQVGFMDQSSGRLMKASDVIEEEDSTIPWVIVRNKQVFYIGHWASSKDCCFLREYVEPEPYTPSEDDMIVWDEYIV